MSSLSSVRASSPVVSPNLFAMVTRSQSRAAKPVDSFEKMAPQAKVEAKVKAPAVPSLSEAGESVNQALSSAGNAVVVHGSAFLEQAVAGVKAAFASLTGSFATLTAGLRQASTAFVDAVRQALIAMLERFSVAYGHLIKG